MRCQLNFCSLLQITQHSTKFDCNIYLFYRYMNDNIVVISPKRSVNSILNGLSTIWYLCVEFVWNNKSDIVFILFLTIFVFASENNLYKRSSRWENFNFLFAHFPLWARQRRPGFIANGPEGCISFVLYSNKYFFFSICFSFFTSVETIFSSNRKKVLRFKKSFIDNFARKAP